MVIQLNILGRDLFKSIWNISLKYWSFEIVTRPLSSCPNTKTTQSIWNRWRKWFKNLLKKILKRTTKSKTKIKTIRFLSTNKCQCWLARKNKFFKVHLISHQFDQCPYQNGIKVHQVSKKRSNQTWIFLSFQKNSWKISVYKQNILKWKATEHLPWRCRTIQWIKFTSIDTISLSNFWTKERTSFRIRRKELGQ